VMTASKPSLAGIYSSNSFIEAHSNESKTLALPLNQCNIEDD
jgi:hypothetical protein